ncbi:hypothetical protein PV08_11348 [Exophiala spinifera]|uniref:alpha-galactosidase n=1 Tax=Exophiala spinifera TaxID=91928 RepID=A0A0D1Y669_9EURO|nr:uncharacterized protein PV08_11348 [Exophiala spinifera]KIW10386.1 hypothetical protein PV08_11348 [Exophiala spinifera]
MATRASTINTDVTSTMILLAILNLLLAVVGTAALPQGASLVARSTCSPRPKDLWQPVVGVSWNYQLLKPISLLQTVDAKPKLWAIDLFDNNATTITVMQGKGHRIICYFSAGSYENWRPDAASFKPSDLGNDLDGWPGEKWLNLSSPNVRKIMKARLDLAVRKGCDGVDPDNVDGYDNDNGLDLTEADSVDYVMFLANEAHGRNLSIGLKNAGAIIDGVIDCMEWSVNEQCVAYDECDTYQPFIQHHKPVFHVEYPKGTETSNNKPVSAATKKKYCQAEDEAGFSTILKNINLDTWIETC